MADPKQLTILQSGVAAWNAWRQQYPEEKIDLTRARLRGMVIPKVDFSHADLTDADLTDADLSGASFVGANLTRAVLTRARLPIANFRESVLHKTNFAQTNLATCLHLDLSELVFGCQVDLPTLLTIPNLPPAVLNSLRMAQ